MEVLPSSISYCDNDKRNLEQLLEAFGSLVSLKDIASAYCEAGRDVCMAGELLCNLQGSTSSSSTSASKDELGGAIASSERTCDNVLDKSIAERCSKSKLKKCPVSIGSVSGIIGRQYACQRPVTNGTCKGNKPLKLNSEEFPISEIWGERHSPDTTARSETTHKDVEEFLFKMLGEGFQLDMNVIREVLGLCGFDIEKSIEKLLDLSASTLGKSGDSFSIAAQKSLEKCPDMESSHHHCQETTEHIDSSQSGKDRLVTKNERELPIKDRDNYNLQKEVLEALFSVPERFEEPKRTFPRKQARRPRAFGHVVVEPLTDTYIEHRTATVTPQVTEDENGENEDSYEGIRKSVREYWTTMKEYYTASVAALTKGNHDLAHKLMEQGHFFKEKAREADEKSSQKLLEKRDGKEVMSLDLHDHEHKEARRLLKFHLSTFSGISSIQYLKLIVGPRDEDVKGGTRKRRIIKLLERESIKWTEEENGRMIVIKMDKINPKHLTFAKKTLADN